MQKNLNQQDFTNLIQSNIYEIQTIFDLNPENKPESRYSTLKISINRITVSQSLRFLLPANLFWP